MTSNQINYQRLLEDRRHNEVTERETKRANKASERNTAMHTEMMGRYNDAYIEHLARNLQETGRHNLASESKDLLYLNRTTEETHRHNKASEDLSRQQINNNYRVALGNLDLAGAQLSESMRHAQVSEALTSQNNLYNYILGRGRNEIEDLKRVDTARSNTQQQLLRMQQLNEDKRHNRFTESISDRQLNISSLTNLSEQANSWYRTLRNKSHSRKR